MSFEIELYECSKCEKLVHKNKMLVNTVDKTLICIECAYKLSPEEVDKLLTKYLSKKEAKLC